MSDALQHSVEVVPGHDCIRHECKWDSPKCAPGAGGSHGKGTATLRFLVRGPEGVLQFHLLTGWLPGISGEWEIYAPSESGPMPIDLGYHSRKPLYGEHLPIDQQCDDLDGAECYYDGSGLNAHLAFAVLCNGGTEALWPWLDAVYEATWRGGAWPAMVKYPKGKRQ